MSDASELPEGYHYPRERATQYDIARRKEFLIAYAREHYPVTVRGLYYQAEVAGLPGITKEDNSYGKIQRLVLELRRNGEMPYAHIADMTRWMRKPRSHDSVKDAMEAAAQLYRRNLWRDAETYVEIWCEKDALAGVICPVTSEYDVPLMVTRGYSSETFAYTAIEAREDTDKDFYVYYLGDFDRSGQDAARSLEEKLKRFAADQSFDIIFKTIAVTEQQITEMGLSTREPKRKSAADKLWLYDAACELDAIDPDTLRTIVREAIEQHLPAEQLEILKAAEESERQFAIAWAGRLSDEEDDTDTSEEDNED
jgi:hypothetical protein